VSRLAAHGALVRHLPVHPFEDLDPSSRVLGHQAAGLVREVLQDRAGLEDGDRLATADRIVVHDRGHAVVRADLEERRLELVASGDVAGNDPVGERELLERDAHLPAVRGGEVVEIDHARSISGAVHRLVAASAGFEGRWPG